MLGLSTAETAEVLKRTPGAIRALQHRASVVLRDRLTALGREPERDDGSTKMKRWLPQATVLRARRFSL